MLELRLWRVRVLSGGLRVTPVMLRVELLLWRHKMGLLIKLLLVEVLVRVLTLGWVAHLRKLGRCHRTKWILLLVGRRV